MIDAAPLGAAPSDGAVDDDAAGLRPEAELARLPPDILRRRWRVAFGRAAPATLSRGLMVRILLWREQILRVGDIDAKTAAVLAAALRNGATDDSVPAAPASRNEPRPGSVLVREHAGVPHRVMVLETGYAWNGQTFASLSAVARAITGTAWNGRRFFGLDRPEPVERRIDPSANQALRSRCRKAEK